MASGDDPLADMQNILGYQGLVGPNPYDPFPLGNQTQTGIPFSGGAGPGVGFIAGWPTNAFGQPIQPQAGSGIPSPGSAGGAASPAAPPGTTLNSMPGATGGQINYAGMGSAGPAVQELMNNYQAAQAKLTPQQQYNQQQANAVRQQMLQQQDNLSASANAGGGFGQSPGGAFNPGSSYSPLMGQAGAPAAAGPPAAASGAMGPSGLTRQQYLSLLANPGPLPTYGAGPPQAGQTRTGTPTPNVMQAYLATQGGKNTPFVNTLNKLQGATA